MLEMSLIVEFILLFSRLLQSSLVNYNGVSYSGIQNNQAYLSAELKFLTLVYKPFDMKLFQLCNDNLVQADQSSGDCPADGSYIYSIPYKLPAAGAGHPVWLATGFQGTGIVRMYAAQDERMLIGECHLKLKTYVTHTEENTYGPLSIPSAAVSLGMASALVALIGLCCCYSRCCIRRKVDVQDSASENEALFTRMEDDKPVVVRSSSATTNQPTIAMPGDAPIFSDTENPTRTELETPRQQKPLQMPLM